jgi:hypothetical protein
VTGLAAPATRGAADLRGAVRALVEEDRVHRDLYLSDDLFALEQRHFFANTWTYLGHASQVPEVGDYLTLEIAGRPLVMVRQPDGGIRVLFNRCATRARASLPNRTGTSAATSAARTTRGPTGSTAPRWGCR